MSKKKIVNLTPTVQPDVVGDIEKGNGFSITSKSTLQVHISSVVNGTTPQLVIDGQVVKSTLKKATVGYTLTTVNKLSDGPHTVAYKYKTTSGQVGELSPKLTVTVDTIAPKAPAAPVIYENANGGINAVKAADGIVVNVSLKGTNAQEGDTLNVMLDGVVTPYTLKLLDTIYGVNVTVPKAIIDLVGQGTIPVTVSITDAAKNTGPQSPATNIIINTRVPNAPSSLTMAKASDGYLNADAINNGVTVDFSLKATNAIAGDKVTVLVGSIPTKYVLTSKDIANQNAHINIAKSTFDTLGQGGVEVSAKITSVAKNESPQTQPISIVVDTISPNTPLYAPSVPENDKGGINIAEAEDGIKVGIVLSGTNAVAGDTIEVYLDAEKTVYTLAAKDIASKLAVITVAKSVLDRLGAGSVNVSAIITDAAGNTSKMSAMNGITLHTTPLNAPVVSTDFVGKTVDAQTVANGINVHVALSKTNAEAGDTVNVSVNGISTPYILTAQDIAAKTADVPVPQFVLNAASDGVATTSATLIDTAGNVSGVSHATTFTLSNTVPTFIENGTPVSVFAHRTGLEKVADTMLRRVEIQIANKLGDGTDMLTFTDNSQVHGSFDKVTGVLTLTAVENVGESMSIKDVMGLAPKSAFESVLKTVKYYSTSENPTDLGDLTDTSTDDIAVSKNIRVFNIDIKDTLSQSTYDKTTINMVGVEDLPSMNLGSDANFLVSADLPTDPTVAYDPDKLPYVDSGMTIIDLDDPRLFGGLIRIANWNWKTDAFTLDMQDTQGVIKPVLFDVRTAANVEEAVNLINNTIRNSLGNGQYGLTYEGLLVNDKAMYVAQGEDYGSESLAIKGALVNAENKATLGFLQLQLGYVIAAYDAGKGTYITPYTIPISAFSPSDDSTHTGVFNTLRIASNEVSVDRPVEFIITGGNKGASEVKLDDAMNMSEKDVLDHFSGSTSVITKSVQLDFTTNNAPVVSLLPNLDLIASEQSITLNTIADIEDKKDSTIADESDHLQHATVTLYNVPDSYSFYIAPLKSSTQGKALSAQSPVLEGVAAHTPTARYNEADMSWTIEFDGVDTPENYQAMLNRLTIDDPYSTGGKTAEMVISLKDAANNGTAENSKVTTLKTTVNLSFQAQIDDLVTIPTKKAYLVADTTVHDAPQLTLTGIANHPVEALHSL